MNDLLYTENRTATWGRERCHCQAACDLDLWPLHPRYCDTMYIYCNTCLSGLVKIRWI